MQYYISAFLYVIIAISNRPCAL